MNRFQVEVRRIWKWSFLPSSSRFFGVILQNVKALYFSRRREIEVALFLFFLFFLKPHTTNHQSPPLIWCSWFRMPDLQCLTNRLYLRLVSLEGYRSVPLKNGYDENLELASLLVHIQIQQDGVSAFTRASGVSALRRCLTWPRLSHRGWRRRFTRRPASWRSSRRPAPSLSCTTRTATCSAPPSPASTTTSWGSPARPQVRLTGLLYWKQVFKRDKSEQSTWFFSSFRSKEEKMIDSQAGFETTCFVPDWWRIE